MVKLHDALAIATYEAERVIGYRYRHGCVIYDKDGVIAKGRNKQKYHPQLRRYGYTKRCWLHAESDALLKCAGKDLRKATLLVVRKQKTKFGNSKPCPCCMAMIRECGLDRITYTDTLGGIVSFQIKYFKPKNIIDVDKIKVQKWPE